MIERYDVYKLELNERLHLDTFYTYQDAVNFIERLVYGGSFTIEKVYSK